ncbi:UNVERIFIED_CONTAM: hypothetical protein FKN15_057536 [Acipenser sinensis]
MIGPNPVRTLYVEGSRGLSQSASLERLRSSDHMEPLILEDSCTTNPEGPVRPYPKKTALMEKKLPDCCITLKRVLTGTGVEQPANTAPNPLWHGMISNSKALIALGSERDSEINRDRWRDFGEKQSGTPRLISDYKEVTLA